MATNSLHSIHQLIKGHNLSNTVPNTHSPSQLFLKPNKNNNTTLSLSLSSNSCVTFSLSQATSTNATPSTSQEATISYDLLKHHLTNQEFQKADEETRRLLIALAGEGAQSRGYVFFSEVQFISESDLRAIDELWREHSKNKFGYSVQKRIFEKANKDFTKFFIKVVWMKKLDTEVEQYNYRSFPSEFIWELNDDTPEGHLPLTNALRGTQLLNNILNHPAFDVVQGEGDVAAEANGAVLSGLKEKDDASSSKPLIKKVFKTDYSF